MLCRSDAHTQCQQIGGGDSAQELQRLMKKLSSGVEAEKGAVSEGDELQEDEYLRLAEEVERWMAEGAL